MTVVSIIFVLVVFMIAFQAIERDGHPLKKLINTFWVTALIALIFGVNEGEHLGSFFYQGQLNIFMMLFLPIAAAILFKSSQGVGQSKNEGGTT